MLNQPHQSFIIHALIYLHVMIFIFQNIRVMAKYYTQVEMSRMAQLLDLTQPVRITIVIWGGGGGCHI